MLVEMLKGKIHGARITECNIDYSGSITVDADLLEAAGILPYEKVLVGNMENGKRFTTYAIEGKRGSGIVGANGAAALLNKVGDRVLILSFCLLNESEAKKHKPKVIIVDAKNRIKS